MTMFYPFLSTGKPIDIIVLATPQDIVHRRRTLMITLCSLIALEGEREMVAVQSCVMILLYLGTSCPRTSRGIGWSTTEGCEDWLLRGLPLGYRQAHFGLHCLSF